MRTHAVAQRQGARCCLNVAITDGGNMGTMRCPKPPESVALRRVTDDHLHEVFELLREHRGAIHPPKLNDAYERYRSALEAELDSEERLNAIAS